MQAIKIVSNPYRKTIEFFSRSADEETWEIIAQESNPGSKLISEEIRTGFFPYKIREITAQVNPHS
ncbi:MAG: hypothetical protein MR991_07340 [Clostridiales bacterium]|nr:hypothetical protein [Clostridiales bacterium]MDD7035670.1 hypothetical protein [Bacillota bacterium]MDY2920682.1 hypothetical protein [Lentihominibacter sp.]